MRHAIRLALAGASVLALAAPVLAAKADKASSRYPTAKQTAAPAGAQSRARAPIRSGTGRDFRIDHDHASSPFAPGGY